MKNSNISFSEFCDGFTGGYKDNFSYQGKRALYDYLTDYEESVGEELEYDPIAFCCEYTEYSDLTECLKEHDSINNLDDLRDHTTVIEMENGGIIIQDF